MIVVIGSLLGRREADRIVADGLASRIAFAVASHGRSIELVARIGDDQSADAVLQDLARGGVGHVAILRDAAHATPIAGSGVMTTDHSEVEGADVELALRYLTDFTVIVLSGAPAESIVTAAARAAEWGEAALVVIRDTRDDLPAEVPDDAIILVHIRDESSAAFATRVADLAVALDAGQDRATALRVAEVRSAR